MSDQYQAQDQLKTSKFKLARDPRALTILEFIKSNQTDTAGVTMDKVAKYMNEKGLCSRPTTRGILFSLRDEGIIEEKERRNTYFHDLVLKEGYSFEGLLIENFLSHVEDLKESLKPFNTLIEGKKILTNHAVTKNAKELLLTISVVNIDKPQEKEKDVYTPKQMEKIALDVQNKIVDQSQKRLRDQVYPPRKTTTKTRRK